MRGVCVLVVILTLSAANCALNQESFPDDFSFGVGSSAYQIEGAWNQDGKGPSIWDYWTHTGKEFILDGRDANVSSDSYNRLDEDIKLLKDLGVQHYRFSLSWPRILPTGFTNKVNPDAINYYSSLMDALAENNITAMVVIFNWDMPKALYDIGGWVNSKVVQIFKEYAKFVVDNFGEKVEIWLTFHDPYGICMQASGISGFHEYTCMHNVLRAHAEIYRYYKNSTKYKGKMSINFNSEWWESASEATDNTEAQQRALQFMLGWYANPIFSAEGDYPDIIKERILERSELEGLPKSRLPEFTEDEIQYIKGTADFFALSHFTTHVASDNEESSVDELSFQNDLRIVQTEKYAEILSASAWLYMVPTGFTNILKWIKDAYGDVEIYITGNGYADNGELNDEERIEYILVYLSALLDAIYNYDINVKAYTFWSFLDSFEWREGYSHRFGLYHVDITQSNRTRTAKDSVAVYKDVVEYRTLNNYTVD